MRKLLVLLVITALFLGAACSTNPVAVDEPDDKNPVTPSPDDPVNPPPAVTEPGTEGPPAGTVVWETSVSGEPNLIGGKLLFFDPDRIFSIDINTGDIIWDHSLSDGGFQLQYGYLSELYIYHEETGAITYALLGDGGASLEHLDISTGEVLWRTPVANISDYDEVHFWYQEDLIFTQGSGSNSAMPLRIQDGKPIAFSSQTSVNCFEDCFYAFPSIPAGSSAAFTFAKYNLSGEKVWETELDTQGADYTGAYVARLIDGTVLFNMYRLEGDKMPYRVYAVDDGCGTVLWAKDGRIGDTMTVDNQGVYCLLTDEKASLLDATSGMVITEFDLSGVWISSSNNTVYIHEEDSLKALDVKTGGIVWENNIEHFSYEYEEFGILWGRSRQESYSDDPPVYTLYAIKMDTGKILTEVDFLGEQGGYGTPMHLQVIEVAGKRYIYLTAIKSNDGGEEVAFFDAATGDRLWDSQGYKYSHLLTDQDGNKSVLFSGTDSLKKVQLPAGEVAWEYPTDMDYLAPLVEEPYIVLRLNDSDGASIYIYVDYYTGVELHRFSAEGNPICIIEDSILTIKDRRLRLIAPPHP